MFKSMKTALFLTYSSIILIVFAIFVLFFNAWSTRQLRGQAMSTLESFGVSIQDQLVQQIEQLNGVSLNVMYSNLVKSRFASYMSDGSGQETDSTDGEDASKGAPSSDYGSASAEQQERIRQNDDAKVLTDALTAIIGPSRLVEQIYLYSFNGRYYGTGFDNREHVYKKEDTPFIDQLLQQQPGKLVSDPKLDLQLSKYYSSAAGRYSISLYRLLYDEYNVPIGAIEVKQYAYRVLASAADFESNNPYRGHIYVLNRDGGTLYPFEHDDKRSEAFSSLIAPLDKDADAYRSFPFKDPVTGEKQLLSLHYSASTGWYTILTTSERDLFRPLKKFTFQLFGTAFVLLALGIGLSFYAANKITFPIYRIRRAVRNFSFEHIGSNIIAQQKMKSGFIELDELHDAFQRMSERLKQSLDHLLLAEAQSLQSQLNALQTQMNPHYLYNTLTNLQEMAEQRMNEPLIAMIEHMSDGLRYITSKERQAPLRDELTHTVNYLEINKVRFGDKLTYRVAVPEEMLAQTVPKLVVQPLAENSIKFGMSQAPPWRIDIIGTLSAANWQIEVRDYGSGFEPDKLAQLQERLASLETSSNLPALELNGMGLLNIYLRLKLIYGENRIFEIRNLPEGGASVRIGGLLHKE
ncbi:sensor histidine kinase [Cohnella hashimotonis]|uniref:Histidine kinase n=1 Tax=Cohnella hashimotonis TaxID=2826895 RepID=A0ABT6TEF8_9BACL|nr:sensor histidine kinase [Cohnella hashimotonis]MDI4644708.1 histidine kinase [Cohnella hashimotonis]